MKKHNFCALTLTGLTLISTTGGVALAEATAPENTPRPMSHVYKFQQPKALFNVSEDSEDLYDQAFASNWTKARAALAVISRDDAVLIKTQPSLKKRSDGVAALAVAVKRDIAAKDRPAALRDINQMTRLTIEMGAAYTAPIPVEVSLLDYYGRELQVWAIAGDKTQLQHTLGALQATWSKVRPQVVARRGGAKAARSFDAMVGRAKSAQSPASVAKVAAPLLEEVDRLENVFA